ncbi:MAG TPA: ATP-dependent DNA ligase [Acidimicrobiia bacterium]|nr:ATP-dependent DNA ligase [Acidimicrobiia bacterium]
MPDFAALVAVSHAVGSTSSRKAKTALLADYLRPLPPEAIAPAVAFLSGVIPQGALGVGWATLSDTPQPAPTPSLQLEDVSGAFDRLSATAGAGSNAVRRRIAGEVFAAATEAEQRFLFGLIGGEIRQGALEGVMAEALAAAADVPVAAIRRAVMLNGRIWDVAQIAQAGGEQALASLALTVFRPVKPMLAQTADDVDGALATTGPAHVEWKIDGIRIQVHRAGDRVEIYTRNLNRVTDRLDEVADLVRRFPADSFVVDGEALWLAGDGRPARFQETAGRFGTGDLPERGLRPYLFDILHLDGEDLIDLPLSHRRDRLEAIAGEFAVPGFEATDGETGARVLADALRHGHEGVVVKGLDSLYEAGRRGAAWVKVKPVLTLDLVVLAAEWGHGRRQGWLSNLHLGARHGDEFVMLGKTFKGLTDELLRWQTERLQAIEVRRTQSTVFVRPELVVEIALDGVQVSTRYPGGVALRFARVRAYRADKEPNEADTLDTVRALGGLPPLGA